MTWYQTFNAAEAGLWVIMAIVIPLQAKCASRQQRLAVVLACLAFLAFAASDLLEINFETAIPWWLWGMKIACGTAILAARYTWLGWEKFRWRDREFLFGIFLLAATVTVIVLQSRFGSSSS